MIEHTHSNGYVFSQSRLDRIAKGSLDGNEEYAVHMGCFDKIIDRLWRGGAKLAAVKEAYAYLAFHRESLIYQLNQEDASVVDEVKAHMAAIQLGMREEHADKFNFSVDVQKGKWSYHMKIGDISIVRGDLSTDAFKTMNRFISREISSGLLRVMTEIAGHDVAFKLWETAERQFERMDSDNPPAVQALSSFSAYKLSYVKYLLTSENVKELISSKVEMPLRIEGILENDNSVAELKINEKSVCKIKEYGDKSYNIWLGLVLGESPRSHLAKAPFFIEHNLCKPLTLNFGVAESIDDAENFEPFSSLVLHSRFRMNEPEEMDASGKLLSCEHLPSGSAPNVQRALSDRDLAQVEKAMDVMMQRSHEFRADNEKRIRRQMNLVKRGSRI